MADIAALSRVNAARWAKMQILPARELEVEKVASRLSGPKVKAIYQQIALAVWGKPDRWWFVAIVHEREAAQNFACSIAQGDRWNERSTHVPRGIGPFKSFVDAAVFTLTRLSVGGHGAPANWADWSIGGVLTLWELYNGTGYEDYHHEASPYDWGATSIEQEGKYTADSKFDPSVWDAQIGCAAMLKAMMAIDASIVTYDAPSIVPAAVPPAPPAPPAPAADQAPAPAPIPRSTLATLEQLLAEIRGRLGAAV